MSGQDFEAVFDRLRQTMLDAAAGMKAAVDRPGLLEMHAPWANPAKPQMPMWFGAVRIGKAYVSYHLMPVYSHPKLAKTISPALKARMQGKSCFNFKNLDADLLEELRCLTAEAARLYAKPFKMKP